MVYGNAKIFIHYNNGNTKAFKSWFVAIKKTRGREQVTAFQFHKELARKFKHVVAKRCS